MEGMSQATVGLIILIMIPMMFMGIFIVGLWAVFVVIALLWICWDIIFFFIDPPLQFILRRLYERQENERTICGSSDSGNHI